MRCWQVLLGLGFAGLASLLLLPFERIVPLALPVPAVRLLALVQPAVFTLIAVIAGEAAARRTALGAPLIDAWLARGDVAAVLRRQIPPALLAGSATALVLLVYGLTAGRVLEKGNRLGAFDVPLVAKLLYGGITEEILMRWGLVSVLVWAGWRLTQRPARVPAPVFAAAVGIAALLFAAGHLPLLFAVAPHASAATVAAVIAGNGVGGLIFGALYVRHGIEAAMMAHMIAHLLATLGMLVLA